MMDKVRENRLRRMAQRQGLFLEKSRRRDVRAQAYGLYAIRDARTGNLMSYPGANDLHTLTLDDAERYLLTGD